MECFSGLWSSRRVLLEEGQAINPQTAATAWLISENASPSSTTTTTNFNHFELSAFVKDKTNSFEELLRNEMMAQQHQHEDLRELIKLKAEKHREYYEKLTGSVQDDSVSAKEMASSVQNDNHNNKQQAAELRDLNAAARQTKSTNKRQRRTGVYEIKSYNDDNSEEVTIFKSVKLLRENYLAMWHKTVHSFNNDEDGEENKSSSLMLKEADDVHLQPPPSGYCSSTASGASDDERDKNWEKNKVQRCGSSDSAMGHSDEDTPLNTWKQQQKEDEEEEEENSRNNSQVAAVSAIVQSPYSPRGSIDHENVPSRTLIEAQYVPYPVDRKLSDVSDCVDEYDGDGQDSRRQSCFTDDGDEQPRYRYWRTPSVVVSDYSDDIIGGLTLEDIEYIRNHRKENSSSPDSSLHSSCSNLNYCGSTISSLESEYVLRKPFRKSSNCSTCSTLSGDEDTDGLHPIKVEVMEKLVNCCPNYGNSPEITCSPSPCIFDASDNNCINDRISSEGCLLPNRSPSRSPSPGSDSTSPRLSRRGSNFRRSASPINNPSGSRRGSTTSCAGYEQYQKSLLEVPMPIDYGYASSDDLSSEWDSDVPEMTKKQLPKASGWRKLRNIVQWTPFFQTYKKQRYPWVQLAGHQGNFKAGPDQGTILKKLCVKEEKCFKVLMKDVLRPYVPEYKGLVASDDGECSYIQLQDLLGDFVSPCVMDCKIGVRTYLEEELAKAKEKPKLRKDMYDKMCQIDSNAPTDEEHKLKGVTKPRYMVWRETISSTATLGFRIEGIRKADGSSTKDFKTTKSKDQIIKAFSDFVENFPHALPKYIQRLKAIKVTLETSQFFSNHEVIGSSLLFVHDRYNANVWLIDFAKTIKLPEDIKITHNLKWKVGNHEDGYLIGVNNLISIFMNMLEQQPVTITPPLSLQEPTDIHNQSHNN